MQTTLAALGITLRDPRLLAQALTHRSYINEQPESLRRPDASNERLEFLGDAVLNTAVAHWLYQQFPQHSEGELTTLRAALVRTSTLARIARELDLGQHVRLSRDSRQQHLHERDSLLADVFEAVIGAIFLDQGLPAVQQFLEPLLHTELARIAVGDTEIDYRTRLQEITQAAHNIQPTYRLLNEVGPAHERTFTMEVLIGSEAVGVGTGRTKQAAAQAAARAALAKLNATEGASDAT